MERRLEPGPVLRGDVYKAQGLPRIPRTLTEAIAELEASAFARRAFGDEVVDHLLHFARSEEAAFEGVVTDFERARYFERV